MRSFFAEASGGTNPDVCAKASLTVPWSLDVKYTVAAELSRGVPQ
jgi:hypothetical protein